MEQLIEDGAIQAVLDLTTTELADELAGGVMSAGPHRLEAAGRKGIPQLVCPGAIDMVNFGPAEQCPPSSEPANFTFTIPRSPLCGQRPRSARR